MGKDLPDDNFCRQQLNEQNYYTLKTLIEKRVKPSNVKTTLEVMWDLRKHSISQCYEFRQLPPDFDHSLETWLSGTSYTSSDKDKFRKEMDIRSNLTSTDEACKCFIKAETYPEFKYPRPIKSRTDRFKCNVGPIFQGINDCLFENLEYFIKKVPVSDRPKVMGELFSDVTEVDCTDFSSFEAHFIDVMMFAIEFPFYEWTTSQLQSDVREKFMDNITVLLMSNKCKFVDFTIKSMSRASGEMNTSSGNGYANKTLFSYVARVKRAMRTRQKFEGDDGAVHATPTNALPTAEDYERLGWICKLIKHTTISEASFCGIVSDPIDLINVCDIRAYIADFGWTRNQYCWANLKTHKALIRAKGYSAIYQYPGCPIIDALGHYALRITNQTEIQRKMLKMYRKGQLGDSRYKNQKFEGIFKTMIQKIPPRKTSPPNTRLLVEKLFGVSVSDQIKTEQYLDSLTEIQILDFDFTVPEAWIFNTDQYVSNYPEPTPNNELKQLVQYLDQFGLTPRKRAKRVRTS